MAETGPFVNQVEAIAIAQNAVSSFQGVVDNEAIVRAAADNTLDAKINRFVNASFAYGGLVRPTSPASPIIGKAFFVAAQTGTYQNYGNVVLPPNSLGFISKDDVGYSITYMETDLSLFVTIEELDRQVAEIMANASSMVAAKQITQGNVFSPEATGEKISQMEQFILDITAIRGVSALSRYYIFNLVYDPGTSILKVEIKKQDETYLLYSETSFTPPVDDTRFNHKFKISLGEIEIDFVFNWAAYTPLLFNETTYEKYKLSNNTLFTVGSSSLAPLVELNRTDVAKLQANDYKAYTNQNIFAKSATLNYTTRGAVEKFILSMKMSQGYNPAYSYFISSLSQVSATRVLLTLSTTDPAPFNGYLIYERALDKGTSNVQEYVLDGDFASVKIKIVLNWDFYTFGDQNVLVQGANAGRLISTLNPNNLYDNIDISSQVKALVRYENILGFDLTKNNPFVSGSEQFMSTQQEDGVRLILSSTDGSTSNFGIYSAENLLVDKNRRYAIFADYTINQFNGASYEAAGNADSFFITLQRLGKLGGGGFSDLNSTPARYKRSIVFDIDPTADISNQYRLSITHRNNKQVIGVVVDVTFHNLMIIDLGLPGDYLYTKTPEEITLFLSGTGYFKELYAARNAEVPKSIFEGRHLVSYGDSVSETILWQPHIAAALGMSFSKTEALTGRAPYPRTTQGGTRLVPAITSSVNGVSDAAGASIYERAKFAKFYAKDNDVIFLFAGFNDLAIGSSYNSSQPPIPSDYGINDAPYKGDAVNLVTNPAALVPSFGACYRGIVESMLTEIPNVKLYLCTLYWTAGSANDQTSNRAKSAVIRQIAFDYGLPLIDLEKESGINKVTYPFLLKDTIHPHELGALKIAEACLKSM